MITYIDDDLVAAIAELGGVSAIAISHPHFYGSMIEFAHAFDAPVYIHSKDRPWVARPDDSVVFWDGDTREIGDGLTLINAGVHFDGGQVLHWAADPEGNGALFSGDIFTVVPDRRWVSFMYSYPNHIPERPRTIRRALSLMQPFRFDRIYGAWWRRNVAADGVAAISRSAERYRASRSMTRSPTATASRLAERIAVMDAAVADGGHLGEAKSLVQGTGALVHDENVEHQVLAPLAGLGEQRVDDASADAPAWTLGRISMRAR